MINSMYNTASNGCPGTEVLTDNTYLIEIEMVDGSSQLVHITKEQAVALGIECNVDAAQQETQAEKPVEKMDTDEGINIDEIRKGTNGSNKQLYNCKVVQPEDLNLCSTKATPAISLPRGRRKKKPVVEEEPVIQEVPPPKIKKQARTRSGRITRPPAHMEKDFAKILTDETPSQSIKLDVSTTEFEALTTNGSDEAPAAPVKVVSAPEALKPKKKKRNVPSQYRCPTCQKVYLGRNQMSRHLRKHPDHGVVSQQVLEDCEAWCSLVETALKSREGNKGIKFCKELVNLVKNARTLAKYFFKPTQLEKCEYYVDDFLSEILNIKPGWYRFNENDLCKDISIFSFLDFFDDDFTNSLQKFEDKTQKENIISLGDELDCQKKIVQAEKQELNVDLHFESDIMDVITKENQFAETHKAEFDCYTNKAQSKEKSEHFSNIFDYLNEPKEITKEKPADITQVYDLYLNQNQNKGNDKQGKEVDIFRNTINNILSIGASDEHMINLLDKQQEKPLEMQSSHIILEETAKKVVEFDLHKLHLLSADISDILPDENHVNILDTSTNSDDIMNVDQFVNERFKKLTEADAEIQQGNGLGLEMPALECFNFHSSV